MAAILLQLMVVKKMFRCFLASDRPCRLREKSGQRLSITHVTQT